jgi:ABC-type sugar transport system ATPase subunit
MTVREHLAFYAKIRGVENVPTAVDHMIRKVGLQPFADRLADKLSGGNKRKLSLAIALVGAYFDRYWSPLANERIQDLLKQYCSTSHHLEWTPLRNGTCGRHSQSFGLGDPFS